MKYLIVGGSGFVGVKLANRLLSEDRENRVVLFDRIPPNHRLCEESVKGFPNPGNNDFRLGFFKGQLLSNDDVTAVLSCYRPDVVYHLASYGMSGSAGLDSKTCELVNVEGTRLLLKLAQAYMVKCFIYISSNNAAFQDIAVVNGNEKDNSYIPEHQHFEHYGRTKAIAEKLVLSVSNNNNNNKSDAKHSMYTCAIRPGGIYGEGESRHFVRMMTWMALGFYKIFICSGIVTDWVHVDNLTQALSKATNMLYVEAIDNKSPAATVVNNQFYYISDGTPTDNNQVLKAFLETLGMDVPKIIIPFNVAMYMGKFCEALFHISDLLTASLFSIKPFMTTSEVHKVGLSNYFSIEKACKDFGYKPVLSTEEGWDKLATYMKTPEASYVYGFCDDKNDKLTAGGLLFNLENKYYVRLASWYWYILILGGMSLLYMVAFLPHTELSNLSPFMVQVEEFSLGVYGSKFNLVLLFYCAVFVHVLEGIYAMYLAKVKLKCHSMVVLYWGLHTVFMGYGSLGLLVSRINSILATKLVE